MYNNYTTMQCKVDNELYEQSPIYLRNYEIAGNCFVTYCVRKINNGNEIRVG